MSASEIETEARILGWRPVEEFKGKESEFVDAETFVKRGREVMPILRQNNQRLERELQKTQSQLTEIQTALADAKTAVTELKTFNTTMAREAAEAARKDLLEQLKAAKRDGNVDREVELTDQISETSAAIREAKKAPVAEEPAKKETPKAPDTTAAKAEFEAWQAENAWYGVDDVKTSVANGVAAKLRKEQSPLVGVEFYKEVAKQTSKILDRTVAPSDDKLEGGGRSEGGGSGGGAKGKKFLDMPQDARDGCERSMKHITIGKGKTFETPAAYREHYAETYFARS